VTSSCTTSTANHRLRGDGPPIAAIAVASSYCDADRPLPCENKICLWLKYKIGVRRLTFFTFGFACFSFRIKKTYNRKVSKKAT